MSALQNIPASKFEAIPQIGFDPNTYDRVQRDLEQKGWRKPEQGLGNGQELTPVQKRIKAQIDAENAAIKRLLDEQTDQREAEKQTAYSVFDAYNAKAEPKIQEAADLARAGGIVAARKNEVSVPGEKELPRWAKAALDKVKDADRIAMDPTYKPKIQQASYMKEPENKGNWLSRGLSTVGSGLSKAASSMGSAAKRMATSVSSMFSRLFS